jgi:hypothetical protein
VRLENGGLRIKGEKQEEKEELPADQLLHGRILQILPRYEPTPGFA